MRSCVDCVVQSVVLVDAAPCLITAAKCAKFSQDDDVLAAPRATHSDGQHGGRRRRDRVRYFARGGDVAPAPALVGVGGGDVAPAPALVGIAAASDSRRRGAGKQLWRQRLMLHDLSVCLCVCVSV